MGLWQQVTACCCADGNIRGSSINMWGNPLIEPEGLGASRALSRGEGSSAMHREAVGGGGMAKWQWIGGASVVQIQ